MSTGLPSVVSDIPANRQLVENGSHGILIPVGDTEKIAERLLYAFSKTLALRRRMGEAAREHIMGNYSTMPYR